MDRSFHVREIEPGSSAEIELVAIRMRQTLIEVLGEAVGGSMYTMNWLMQRVKWHLDPAACTGQVFLAMDGEDQILGHTIVRLDVDFDDRQIGLFSTTYVEPKFRGKGIAKTLIARGESWMVERGMNKAVTYTDPSNTPLLNLFKSLGYRVDEIKNGFAVVVKDLA
jgi:GNAT superfamily N-acetyltransferase